MDTYGIIGYPIKHSLSPAMHNAAFEALCIDAKYEKFDVKPEELEDFLLNRKDVIGFNVTIPHKVRAKEILEKKFPEEYNDLEDRDYEKWYYVEITGAINTVKRTDKGLEYCNTDVEGFLRSLQADLKFNLDSPGSKSVFLIGCGGAGRAVIAGLSLDFERTNIGEIYVYDKNPEAISSLKEHFSRLKRDFADNLNNIIKFVSESDIQNVIKDCQLLINASPVGMKEGDTSSVIDKSLLHKNLSVYDVVYNRETQLVKDAKEKRCKAVVGGEGMLYYQGLYAFRFWLPHVKPLPTTTMRKALTGALNKK